MVGSSTTALPDASLPASLLHVQREPCSAWFLALLYLLCNTNASPPLTFMSPHTHTQVFACKAQVSEAQGNLQALLPRLAAAARVPSLSYVSIQNQGSYLVELPAGRQDVPAGWDKVSRGSRGKATCSLLFTRATKGVRASAVAVHHPAPQLHHDVHVVELASMV